MPQMMPLNWIMLYMYFIVIFILFIIINYFIHKPMISMNLNLKTLKSNKLNWMW
uniref:ATP synthase F0 subunit 8 n=1 Tax=Beraea pullata TaxID=177796 RepID=A0A7G7CEK9_9NEOP|nr:ATP synthase F0 subunit 8 [Beraea pullata]